MMYNKCLADKFKDMIEFVKRNHNQLDEEFKQKFITLSLQVFLSGYKYLPDVIKDMFDKFEFVSDYTVSDDIFDEPFIHEVVEDNRFLPSFCCLTIYYLDYYFWLLRYLNEDYSIL